MTPARCLLLFFLAGGAVAVPLSSPACCGPQQAEKSRRGVAENGMPLEQAIRQEYLQQLHEAKLEQQERQQEELQELVESTEGLRQIADQMVLDLISRSMGQLLRPRQPTAAPLQRCVTRSAVVDLAQRQTAGIVTFTVCGEGMDTALQFRYFIPGETTTAADTTTTVETTTELLTTTTVLPTTSTELTTTTEHITLPTTTAPAACPCRAEAADAELINGKNGVVAPEEKTTAVNNDVFARQ